MDILNENILSSIVQSKNTFYNVDICNNISVDIFNIANLSNQSVIDKYQVSIEIMRKTKDNKEVNNDLVKMAIAVSQHISRNVKYTTIISKAMYSIETRYNGYSRDLDYIHIISMDFSFKWGGYWVSSNRVFEILTPILIELDMIIMENESIITTPLLGKLKAEKEE